MSELNDADVDEEERLREVSFWNMKSVRLKRPDLLWGEDEELETQYKRFINGKKLWKHSIRRISIPEGWIRHQS